MLKKKPEILKVDEFFSGGEKSTLFQDVTDEMNLERRKMVSDPVQIKKNKDWNNLCDKIVPHTFF